MSRTFRQRVDYAVKCLKSGATNTRSFDNCFEMYDGEYVAAAITRLAWFDEALRLSMRRFPRMEAVADQFTALSDKMLEQEAAAERRRSLYAARKMVADATEQMNLF